MAGRDGKLLVAVTSAISLLAIIFYSLQVGAAQGLPWSSVAIDGPRLETSIRALAAQALALPDAAASRAFDRAMLQLGAGQYEPAAATLKAARTLRESESANEPIPAPGVAIYAEAKVRESNGEQFAVAYKAAYLTSAAAMDDRTAFDLSWFLGRHPDVNRRLLQRSLERYSQTSHLSFEQAVELVRNYIWWHASEQFWRLLPAINAADDEHRYITDLDIRVRRPDGATVTAILVRPRAAEKRTALLSFGIYAIPGSLDDARRSASHGYVGIWGFSRGKYHSPDAVVPWEYDGGDARALIDWIARQPWSDGRVGMYGGSYQGFAQWAAMKEIPPALKAVMPSAPTAPGITGPMENNVFFSYQYRFVPYVTKGPEMDEDGYNDMKHWDNLNRAWYLSGRPYREMDQIDGTPNPLYRRLLDHPSYDDYWKRMTPQGKEFAKIDIPILMTTGYYDGAAAGARHYFEELTRYNSRPDVAVLIGPWSHSGAQHQSDPVLNGYVIDPGAFLDVDALRYEWFDYVFKGRPRPALLTDRINYEVMGANVWHHAPSYQAMSSEYSRLYLVPDKAGKAGKLSTSPSPSEFVDLTVNLADRSDVDWLPPNNYLIPELDLHNAVAFVSEPAVRDTEISGVLKMILDFEVNKKDMDLVFRVYDESAKGFLELAMPWSQRASFVRDRSHRRLLEVGKRQQLMLERPAPVSRLVKAGDRLVLVVCIQKERDAQINYGSGKDVSDESIKDAGEPLRVRWYGSSYIEVPVGKQGG